MTDDPSPSAQVVAGVTVRYWAAARAAAGVECDVLPVESGTTLARVLDAVRALHPDRPRLADVVSVCSVLVGDRPVGKADPAQVRVEPGDTVELLPPFAGG
jgi:molybdopterin synthase sulfur carrier subunit